MERGTQLKLELFVENVRRAKEGLGFANAMARRDVAFLYALNEKPINCDAIKSVYALVKSSKLHFRKGAAVFIAAMLSLESDPKRMFDRIRTVYGMMNDAGYKKSSFLVFAAYLVASKTGPEEYQRKVDWMRTFRNSKKLRSKYKDIDECIPSAMLALLGQDVEGVAERVDMFHMHLAQNISGNSNMLNHKTARVMAAAGMVGTASMDRPIAIRDAFALQKVAIPSSVFGAFALLPGNIDVMVQEYIEVQTFIKSKKEINGRFVSKDEVFLYAAAITARGHEDGAEIETMLATVSWVLMRCLRAGHRILLLPLW